MKEELTATFIERYQENPTHFIRCGGRFEVLGNHTDHNHGLCIAATCDMSIFMAVKKTKNNKVSVYSKNYGPVNIYLTNLDKKDSETGSSPSLIRGVASYLVNHGYKVGGFNAVSISTIFKGAGVSSSAAFEVVIGQIFNELYNDGKISRLTLAKAGQYAENEYYGKKCGLLDQIGVSFGGMVEIDFEDINDIKVDNLHVDMKDYSFILVNTGGNHADMSYLYSKIPEDMLKVAKKLHVNFLRESSLEKLEEIKDKIDKNLYLRARHFYTENERVKKAIEAIKDNDIKTLIECINGSLKSSTNDLKNMMAIKYEGSPLEAAELALKLTDNQGAAKINGGGFAGSIVTLIPNTYKDNFIKTMKDKYGDSNVYIVQIDNIGVGDF